MTRSDVTVVVNVHNEKLMIAPTLRSVLQATNVARQNGIAVRLLIAADRPDPVTLETASGFTDFELLVLDHGDLGACRQDAAQAANSEWICFVDGDDLWASNWIAEAWVAATRSEKKAVWHPECSMYFGTSTFLYPHIDMESPEFELRYLAVDNYWTSAVFTATETVLSVPFLPSSKEHRLGHEDWNWHCRTIQRGYLHKVVANTVHFIRRRASSMSTEAIALQKMCIPHTLFAHVIGKKGIFDGPDF